MQWTMLRWTLLCATLSLGSCATSSDSYCVLYRPLVTKRGDAEALTRLPRDQKQIILGNEQIYRDTCKG